jgi:1-acyl-sn-glycerol-3-phosphate acyltransferase
VGGWLLSRLGGFPMERNGPDLKSMRKCIDILTGGESLVIFPEGGRRSGPEVYPIFDGAAYLSIRTGVPIIPVGIWGAEAAMGRGASFPRARRMHMIVGEPLYPPKTDRAERVPRDAMRDMTERLQDRLQCLFKEARLKATHSRLC